MSRKDPRRKGLGAIELMEEAVAVLRRAPSATPAAYYIGTLPFILGLLYFWTDMATSPFAQSRLPGAAFGMSLLYLWMKVWQSVFAARVLSYVSDEPAPRFTARRILRMSVQQAAWQPFSLFAIPASFLLMLPFGWVFAYYHSLSATGNGEDSGFRDVSKRAWSMALLWSGQNHTVIALAWLLWLVVCLNVASVVLFLPELIRMLTGFDTVFTLSGYAIFNTTFYAVVAGITHLCVNPMLKTVYVLRCFYGESLHSGADLKAELNTAARESSASRAALIVVAVLLFSNSICGAGVPARQVILFTTAEACRGAAFSCDRPPLNYGLDVFSTPPAVEPLQKCCARQRMQLNSFVRQRAAGAAFLLTQSFEGAEKPSLPSEPGFRSRENAAPLPPAVSPQKLDETIERVINKREYQWRAPREKQDVDEDRGALIEFIQGIRDWVVRITRPLRDLWKRLIDWLRRTLLRDGSGEDSVRPALSQEQLTLLLVLLAVAAVILGLFLWRVWRRKKEAPVVVAQAVTVVPDLKDENVVASQLPEEEWQALAAELMMKGELRLAMRAVYMASLAFLAGRSLITIARYKSNRDYRHELLRRARERERLMDAFTENVALFERSWYGDHEVTPQLMETFDANHDRIRTHAQE